MGMGVAFLNLTPILPLLQESYAVSNARMGMLVTALILSHSFVQVPAGIVVDQIGVRWSFTLALGLGFLGNVLCIFNPAYSFILTMRILAGLGTGLLFVAGIKYATVHTRAPRQVLVQSVFGCLINTGSAIPFLTSPILIVYSWKLIYLFTSCFFLVPMLAVLFWGEDPLDYQGTARQPLRSVLTVGPVWALGSSHALFFGGMMTIGTWISSYLLTSEGAVFWLHLGGLFGALIIGISALGRFLGGLVTLWIKPRHIIQSALFALAICYALLWPSKELSLVLTLFGVAALMNSITFGSVFSLTYQIMPPQSAGTAIGLVNFIASIGALTFPIVFGYLIDITEGFKYPFLFLAILAILALPPAFSLRKHTPQALADSSVEN
ncbi:MAG TPA: MFS transporter [Acidobacteriota bacterium]|nr:MFS transporter [Acidobacteriota bacterium]